VIQEDDKEQIRAGEGVEVVSEVQPEVPKGEKRPSEVEKDQPRVVEGRGFPPLGISVNLQIDTTGWNPEDVRSLIRWLRGEEMDEEGKE